MREELRFTFGQAAGLYDAARPRYPAAAVADLVRLAGIGPGTRVLEIGPGTGQLTVALAATGCSLVAVELSPELAAVARRNLEPYPNATVIAADFETWPLPAEPFHVAVAATAFHWLDPALRLVKSAAAVGPGGALATVRTEHVAGGSVAFFRDVQACYERWDPSTPPDLVLQPAADIAPDEEELRGSPDFEPPVFRRHEWEVSYTTSRYIDVLLTYSGHRALEPSRRRGLLRCIADLIDREHGGRITKRYLFEVRVARRRG